MARRLAASMMGLALLLILGILWLAVRDSALAPADWLFSAVIIVAVVVSTGTGALVASRHPSNPVGWILCNMGLVSALWLFGLEYARRALVLDPGSLPAGELVGWIQTYLWMLAFLPLPLLLLSFPDGRLLSPRWRPIVVLTIVGSAFALLGFWLRPGPWHLSQLATTELDVEVSVPNPIGIPKLSGLLGLLRTVGGLALFVATLASIAAVVLRFRRRRGLERQQVKWLAFAAASGLFWFVLGNALEAIAGGAGESILSDAAFLLLIATIFMGIPGAIGIAVLRYRLYDIDRIINRTLVYGGLSALLISVYIGAAVGLGALVRSVAGRENNSLVIAASTLAVAALFGPARRRIQGFIDRRFYRRRYDAARTLERFAARLREHVDLDSLSGELVRVVHDTMQPTHVSLWLRPGTPMSGEIT